MNSTETGLRQLDRLSIPPIKLAELSPGVLVDQLIEQAQQITQSRLGYLAILNDTGEILTMLSWSKSAMQECAMTQMPLIYPINLTGLWGDCVRERKTVTVNDYNACKRPSKKGYPAGHVQIIRHLNTPIFEGDKIRGILGVGNKPSPYTQQDEKRLEAFSKEVYFYLQSILHPPQ